MIERTADTFGRVVTAMVTPFDDKHKIDFAAVEKLVNHLADSGSSAVIVSGTTGESPTLDDSEKKELLKAVVSVGKKRIKVIMGTGSNDTAKSIKASQEAESLGADGLLLVAPYYNKPNQNGLKAHFSAIAESTPLPIILYNIPGRTGINIAVETTVELANDHANIVALKDSTGAMDQAQDIARLARSDFRIYSGDDYLTLPFLSVGACGVISVASHLIGNEIKRMVDCFFAGDIQEAYKIHCHNLPLFKGLFTAPNPTCVKYALSRAGLCSAKLRLPLVELDSTQKKVLDDLIKITAKATCA